MTEKYPVRPRFETLIQTLVESGRYESGADVVDAALYLLEDQEKLRVIKLAELNASLDEALADAAAGRVYDAEEVFEEMERLITEEAARRDAAE